MGAFINIPPALEDPLQAIEPSSLAVDHKTLQLRRACPEDLPRLLELERLCWAASIRANLAALQERLQRDPDGQWVLIHENAVAGVIYSQRLPHGSLPADVTHRTVSGLHSDTGRIRQLLAVNVDPNLQPFGFGDSLLKHMLQAAVLDPTIDEVVAVTLCRDYDASQAGTLEDYLHLKNEQGLPLDPIIRFHVLHGARVEGLQRNYRPEDDANQGHGVLVRYDLDKLKTDLKRVPVAIGERQLKQTLEACIQAGLPKGVTFSEKRALRDLGMDSLGALHVAHLS